MPRAQALMEEHQVDMADAGAGIKVEDEAPQAEAMDEVEDQAGETKATLLIENEKKSKHI